MDNKVDNSLPTFLSFGDSVNGKSTFIKIFAIHKEGIVIGGEGDSCTMQCTIYQCYHELYGHFNLIDTRGTNDTNEYDNDAILEAIFKFWMNNSKGMLRISGILYFHDSNAVSRWHCEARLGLLSVISKGIEPKNYMVICTKYDDLKIGKQRELERLLKEKCKSDFVYWDSVTAIKGQVEDFFNKLRNLKEPRMENIETIEKEIEEKAKELWEKDTEKRVEIITEGKTVEEEEKTIVKDRQSAQEIVSFKTIESESGIGINIFGRMFSDNIVKEESVILVPPYPRAENKKITQIAIKKKE